MVWKAHRFFQMKLIFHAESEPNCCTKHSQVMCQTSAVRAGLSCITLLITICTAALLTNSSLKCVTDTSEEKVAGELQLAAIQFSYLHFYVKTRLGFLLSEKCVHRSLSLQIIKRNLSACCVWSAARVPSCLGLSGAALGSRVLGLGYQLMPCSLLLTLVALHFCLESDPILMHGCH